MLADHSFNQAPSELMTELGGMGHLPDMMTM
jgi:hypothetical protein